MFAPKPEQGSLFPLQVSSQWSASIFQGSPTANLFAPKQKHCDKNKKSFFFPYLIKRRLIQQLDNHYLRYCITRIISKSWYIIRLFLARYKTVRKVHEDIQSAVRAHWTCSRLFFAVIVHHSAGLILEFYCRGGRNKKKEKQTKNLALILSVELNSEGNFIYFNRKKPSRAGEVVKKSFELSDGGGQESKQLEVIWQRLVATTVLIEWFHNISHVKP